MTEQTNDQIAAVMLIHGTPKQQQDALKYLTICETEKIDPKLRHGPEIRPETVGELRRFLEQFDADTPLKPTCYGAFRYAIDGECNGQIQMA